MTNNQKMLNFDQILGSGHVRQSAFTTFSTRLLKKIKAIQGVFSEIFHTYLNLISPEPTQFEPP